MLRARIAKLQGQQDSKSETKPKTETVKVPGSIKTLSGDVLKSKADVICHQTNCKGVMGAGIARQIKAVYPKVFKEYESYCRKGSPLGQAQLIEVAPSKYICNIFGQDGYGTNKQQTDYKAVQSALNKLKSQMQSLGLTSVAFPHGIGCGLAGGNWNTYSNMIKETLKDFDIEFWSFKK